MTDGQFIERATLDLWAETQQEQRDAIAALRAQLASANARIAAMESGDWSEVKLVRFENGQMDLSAGPIPAIAEYLAQMMQNGDGKYFNYMEVTIDHKTAGPMTLSLQRKNGKTPNQLRKEANARADRAKAALAAQIEADAGIAQRMRENWMCAAGFEGFATGAKNIVDAIRAQPHDRSALARYRETVLREAADMFDADSNIAQTILALIDKETA